MRLKYFIDEMLEIETNKETRDYLKALCGMEGDSKPDFESLQRVKLAFLCRSFGDIKKKIEVFNKVYSYVQKKKTSRN